MQLIMVLTSLIQLHFMEMVPQKFLKDIIKKEKLIIATKFGLKKV